MTWRDYLRIAVYLPQIILFALAGVALDYYDGWRARRLAKEQRKNVTL